MWTYIWSLGLIIIGIYIIAKKKLEIGILGSPALTSIRGPYAIAVGIIAIIVGLIILIKYHI